MTRAACTEAALALNCAPDVWRSAAVTHPEVIPVPTWAPETGVDKAAYKKMREDAARDPVAFFGEAAKRLDWLRFPSVIRDVSFNEQDFRIRWFADGGLNVSANCIDRHLETRGNE